MDKLYIVIPAFNEEANIVTVVRQWHGVVDTIGGDARLVIVDDGSYDDTYKLVSDLKKELTRLIVLTKSNGGYGSALLCGYKYAISNGADYVFQTDSDGQTFPDDFWKFWDGRFDYEVQIGLRTRRQDGLSRVIISRIMKVILMMIFKVNAADANTPFRLMKSGTITNCIDLIPEGFNLANVLFTVLFEQSEVRMRYLPIAFGSRNAGKSFVNLNNAVLIGLKATKDFWYAKNYIQDIKNKKTFV